MSTKEKRQIFEHHMAENVIPILEAQNEVYGPHDYPFLTTLIKQNHVKRVLDIGTGEGSFILGLAQKTADVEYHAIDASEELIGYAKKNKKQSNNKQVSFSCSLFEESLPVSDFDMILARFSLEHASDIDNFIKAAFQKLEDRGHLAIIEYYIDDGNIDDPIWKEFRKRELAMYERINSHPRLGIILPKSLSRHGFKNIRSSFIQISPSISGAASFYYLVRTSGHVYAHVDPTIWTNEYLEELDKWCNEMLERNDVDPMFFLTHTVGQKLC